MPGLSREIRLFASQQPMPATEEIAGFPVRPGLYLVSGAVEVPGGVSFTKGCYTGQEIVSRVEHIGKTPRRGALAVAEGEAALAPMTEIADGAGSPVGVVVYAAAINGKTAAFVQLPNELLQTSKPLSAAGRTLMLMPLPYGYERLH